VQRPICFCLLCLALLGCNGNKKPDDPAGTQTPAEVVLTPAQLVDDLFGENQKRREFARDTLLAMRAEALPVLVDSARRRGLHRSGEIIKLMIDLGRLRIGGVDTQLLSWLEATFGPETIELIRRGDPKRQKEVEDLSKTFSDLVFGMISLGQRRAIPSRMRVFFYCRILRDLARIERGETLSAQEAVCELLSLGAEAIPEIVEQLNSPVQLVARRFASVAVHMHRKQVVAEILQRVGKQRANNLLIYTTLNYLTMREVWLPDVGEPRPHPQAFAARPDHYLELWHPKFLASWQDWWKRHRDESLEDWWIEGFRRAGHAIRSTRSLDEVPQLIAALKDGSQVVRANAMTCLRRNTYHQQSLSTYLEIFEPFPEKPVPDEAALLTQLSSQWRQWWSQSRDRRRSELARVEAKRALKLLAHDLGMSNKRLAPNELRILFAAEFFLRKLTGNKIPDIPWTGEFQYRYERRRILFGLQTRVDKMLSDPAVLRALDSAPWWF